MFKSVESFVLESRPVSKGPLSADSRLLDDLGMDGDDAVEFMEAFSKECDADMSEFEFNRNFGPEGFSPLALFYFLYCLLGRIFRKDVSGLISNTLRDLVLAAEAKKWHKL